MIMTALAKGFQFYHDGCARIIGRPTDLSTYALFWCTSHGELDCLLAQAAFKYFWASGPWGTFQNSNWFWSYSQLKYLCDALSGSIGTVLPGMRKIAGSTPGRGCRGCRGCTVQVTLRGYCHREYRIIESSLEEITGIKKYSLDNWAEFLHWSL